jgi:low affinity Fe/Cu permease
MPPRKRKFTGRIPNGKIIDELIRQDKRREVISLLESSEKELERRAKRAMRDASKARGTNLEKRLKISAKADAKRVSQIREFLHRKP